MLSTQSSCDQRPSESVSEQTASISGGTGICPSLPTHTSDPSRSLPWSPGCMVSPSPPCGPVNLLLGRLFGAAVRLGLPSGLSGLALGLTAGAGSGWSDSSSSSDSSSWGGLGPIITRCALDTMCVSQSATLCGTVTLNHSISSVPQNVKKQTGTSSKCPKIVPRVADRCLPLVPWMTMWLWVQWVSTIILCTVVANCPDTQSDLLWKSAKVVATMWVDIIQQRQVATHCENVLMMLVQQGPLNDSQLCKKRNQCRYQILLVQPYESVQHSPIVGGAALVSHEHSTTNCQLRGQGRWQQIF